MRERFLLFYAEHKNSSLCDIIYDLDELHDLNHEEFIKLKELLRKPKA